MKFTDVIYVAFDKTEKEFVADDGYTTSNPYQAMWFSEESDMVNELRKMDEPDNFEIWKMKRIYETIKDRV